MGNTIPYTGPPCPSGAVQVGGDGAGYSGCGLTDCGERYSYLDIEECHQGCIDHRDCKAFSWAPLGGDLDHTSSTVCTLYEDDLYWGTSNNQIMCEPEIVYPSMDCQVDGDYVNAWDGTHNNLDNGFRFLSGQDSYHNNHREDRRFKWKYCKPDASTVAYSTSFDLAETAYDDHWTVDCGGRFGEDHAAMIGASSYHSNKKEDRRWTFTCGMLDSSQYALRNCIWTADWVNNWDSRVNYNCPDNGLIKSIESQHSNRKEDRQWKFECCNIVSYAFGRPTGAWKKLISYNQGFTYEISEGIEASHTDTFSSEYSRELSMTVTAGYEYSGVYGTASVEVSVTGTVSQTTVSEISNAFTHSKEVTVTLSCDKDNLFQWIHSVVESVPAIDQRDITIYGAVYKCIDNDSPACPAGWCDDDECTQCKEGYTTGYTPISVTYYPTTFYIIVLVMVLVIINAICIIVGWCRSRKSKRGYKVVSMTSDVTDDDAIQSIL